MIWSEMMASETSPYPWARVADGVSEVFAARYATRGEAEATLVSLDKSQYRLVNTDTGEVVRFEEPC